ncbi:hypothetical protein NKG94_23245 [Micromonospora sp. M12]
MTVVGVIRPLPGRGWDRDPLAAAGSAIGYRDGRFMQPVNAYGPFLVDLADLVTTGSTVDRMEVTTHPDLSHPTATTWRPWPGRPRCRRPAGLHPRRPGPARTCRHRPAGHPAVRRRPTACHRRRRARHRRPRRRPGRDGTRPRRPADHWHTRRRDGPAVRPGHQPSPTRRHRDTRGRARRRRRRRARDTCLVGPARRPDPPAAAGRRRPDRPAGRHRCPGPRGRRRRAGARRRPHRYGDPARPAAGDQRTRRELLARSGVDLLLAVFAAAGWWQLYAQPTAASPRADAVRVLAPALLLTAGAALALRVVLPALRGADRLAYRARGLALPLAVSEAARRPQAVAAGLLVGLACASGTFGLAFDNTWHQSQRDQAALSVGTDLALTLSTAPVAGDGAVVSAATTGVVSPAVNRGVTVGQWLGSAGVAPRLVAVDTTRADALLRGRLGSDREWADVGAALAPRTRVAGLPVPTGAPLVLSGTAAGDTPLTVTPRLLLQDATGLRTSCSGPAVPLDGHEFRLPDCATADGLRLVAVALPVTADEVGGSVAVAVTLTIPPAGSAETSTDGSDWTATSAPPVPSRLTDPTVMLSATPTGTSLRMAATVELGGAEDAAGPSSPPPSRTPARCPSPSPPPLPPRSTPTAAASSASRSASHPSRSSSRRSCPPYRPPRRHRRPGRPGHAVARTRRQRRPDVPGRRLVGRPPSRSRRRRAAAALHLGTVATREAETARLTSGPLRAGLPAALRLTVPAAALLLLAGVVLHVACDLQVRAVEWRGCAASECPGAASGPCCSVSTQAFCCPCSRQVRASARLPPASSLPARALRHRCRAGPGGPTTLAVASRGRAARRPAGRMPAGGRHRGHRPGPPGRRRAPAGSAVKRWLTRRWPAPHWPSIRGRGRTDAGPLLLTAIVIAAVALLVGAVPALLRAAADNAVQETVRGSGQDSNVLVRANWERDDGPTGGGSGYPPRQGRRRLPRAGDRRARARTGCRAAPTRRRRQRPDPHHCRWQRAAYLPVHLPGP